MPKNKTTIILGIDPGFAITGFGVLKKSGTKLITLSYGTITTRSNQSYEQRLAILHHKLIQVINKYKPNVLALEELFFHSNAKTALKVGQARGIVILTAVLNKLPIYHYTPLQVKQAVTSYGRADKLQIQKMIKTLLKLDKLPKPDDAADALAIAFCCANSINFIYDPKN